MNSYPPTLGDHLVGVASSIVSEFRNRGANAFDSHPLLKSGIKWVLLGPLVEFGRRVFSWIITRFRIQLYITAQFRVGDPSYEWMLLFLTSEKVWRRTRDFTVSAKSSARKWSIEVGNKEDVLEGDASYEPTFGSSQLFRWKGHWFEVRNQSPDSIALDRPPWSPHQGPSQTGFIHLTCYTLDMTVLRDIVQESRRRYIEESKPHVTVHSVTTGGHYGHHGGSLFNSVKQKPKRSLDSVVLDSGVVDGLIKDVVEFMKMAHWYSESGIPHHRGYLLHGPPGTGKTSTIYALAGELGLEIYTISLSAGFIDDSYLQNALATVPKNSIILVEDLDAAFVNREDMEDDDDDPRAGQWPGMMPMRVKTSVSFSGLLNALDGVAAEDGKLFFATTNYIDRIDAALMRPGRIDRKVEYALATRHQAAALFRRFFPEDRFLLSENHEKGDVKSITQRLTKEELNQAAEDFGNAIPEHEFSTAEIQGLLLMHKLSPLDAAKGVDAWIEMERADKAAKVAREAARKEKKRKAKEAKGWGKGGMPQYNTSGFMNGGSPAFGGYGANGAFPGMSLPSNQDATTEGQANGQPVANGETSSTDTKSSATPMVNGIDSPAITQKPETTALDA